MSECGCRKERLFVRWFVGVFWDVEVPGCICRVCVCVVWFESVSRCDV